MSAAAPLVHAPELAPGEWINSASLRLESLPAAVVEVLHDGQPLEPAWAGEEVYFENGRSWVRVDAPRLYALARNPDVRPHELRLDVADTGLAVFAFTFTTCVTPP